MEKASNANENKYYIRILLAKIIHDLLNDTEKIIARKWPIPKLISGTHHPSPITSHPPEEILANYEKGGYLNTIFT